MKLPATYPALLLCIALCSCGNQRDEAADPTPMTADTVNPAVSQPTISTSSPVPPLDVCDLAASLPQSLGTIRRDASRVLASPDSCFLRLVDSLASLAGRGTTPDLLVVIDSIYSASDGYASEAVATILPGIFRQDPEVVARYIVDSHGSRQASLRHALVEGMRLERSTSTDPKADRERDRKLFQTILGNDSLPKNHRPFLDSLMKEILAEN